MTTYHKAIAYFGLDFYTKDELDKFIAEQAIQDINDELFADELGIECLNAFSGTEWIIGFKIALGEPLSTYQALWNKAFPNTDLKPIASIEVKTY